MRIDRAEDLAIVRRIHAARQSARDDGDVRTRGEIADHVHEFGEFFGSDLPAHVVDLGEHGLLVDALVVFPYAAAVPDKRKGDPFFVKRPLEHRAVLVIHKARRVRLAAQPRDADRNVDRLARERKCLALDDVDLPDIELIQFDRDIHARAHADRKYHVTNSSCSFLPEGWGLPALINAPLILYYAFSEISRAGRKKFAEKSLFLQSHDHMEIICSVS